MFIIIMIEINRPILSILIPTKDRYHTLKPVLNGLLTDFEEFNVEILVQDNTLDNTEIIEFIINLKSNKIKYFHDATYLSQSGNCNLSVLNSTGKYLILIGDDDYVLPTVIEMVEWMDSNDVECLNYNIASYLWMDIKFKYESAISRGGTLILNKPLQKKIVSIDPIKELKKVLNSGGTRYADLPRLYHGIVNRKVLDAIYEKCNTFFPGLSPDMANSSALAVYVKRFYKYKFPLSISGKSKFSAAGKGVNHLHNGHLNDMPFLDKGLLQNWNCYIPYFWSGDTIYAQSISHSLEKCGIDREINFNRLYAHLFVFESKWSNVIIRKVVQYNKFVLTGYVKILLWIFIFAVSRANNYLLRRMIPKIYVDYSFFESISDASKHIISVK